MPTQPKVNGVSVDWVDVLDVPSGGAGIVNPDETLLTVLTPGDLADEWDLTADGTAVPYPVGSGSWVLTILLPGAAGTVWSFTANGHTATYTVIALDTATLVATGLELAIEALAGVASSSLGAAITVVLDSGANFIPLASHNGAGTFTLSGVAGKDTATEVATGLEVAFDAVLDQGAEDYDLARSGAAMTVTRDDGGYASVQLETDGTGTSSRALGGGTPTGFDPQPTPG